MDVVKLLEVFGAVVAAIGGVEGIKWLITYFDHRKKEHRIKEAETDKVETEAESEEFHLYVERIQELRSSNAELNAQNLELLKAGARKDDIIEDKTAKIRELNETIYKLQRKIMALEKFVAALKRYIEWLRIWHCEREYGTGEEDCLRRKPKQNIPIRYVAFDESEISKPDTADEIVMIDKG